MHKIDAPLLILSVVAGICNHGSTGYIRACASFYFLVIIEYMFYFKMFSC